LGDAVNRRLGQSRLRAGRGDIDHVVELYALPWALPRGQWTIVPLRFAQCEATLRPLVGRVHRCAQPTAKWLYAFGVPKSSCARPEFRRLARGAVEEKRR
jgi:hypothetical protein